MSSRSQKTFTLFAFVSIVLLANLMCFPPIPGWPTQAPDVFLADYGDAPDEDLNMDTGYYVITGGPWLYNVVPGGILAKFPTVGRDLIPGPFMLDVDDFFIGPLYGVFSADDIPSREDDATDINDIDGVANLLETTGRADCDRENGAHNPAATGCMPLPPSYLLMNARLLIFFGYPPLGIFITAVNTMENAEVSGPAYWNLAIDLNQDGEWGSSEWIVQDMAVTLTPGERTTLISGAFRWPTSGTPWGRLIFPVWARSMVTLDRVSDVLEGGSWDGRGIEAGFSHGEVEDYFLEWRPLGQMFEPQPTQEVSLCQPSYMPSYDCPAEMMIGETYLCTYDGPAPTTLDIFCLSGMDHGGVGFIQGGEVLSHGQVTTADGLGIVCQVGEFWIEVQHVDGGVSITPFGQLEQDMPAVMSYDPWDYWDYTLDEVDFGPCNGTPPVGISSMNYSIFRLMSPELIPFGLWQFDSVVKYDPLLHAIYINLLRSFEIIARSGSIVFEGSPPWVNVSGTLNEDGSFYAQGQGVVAGYQGIAVTFEGQISGTNLTGVYTMGAEGGLPGGEPIRYAITGSKMGPASADDLAALPEGVAEAIEAFVLAFNTAFANGDVETLLMLLHPEIFDLYGEEACRSHVGLLVDSGVEIEVLDITRIGQWDFERDGHLITLADTYALDVNMTVAGQTTQEEVHLMLPGDDSVRWITDCGDALP